MVRRAASMTHIEVRVNQLNVGCTETSARCSNVSTRQVNFFKRNHVDSEVLEDVSVDVINCMRVVLFTLGSLNVPELLIKLLDEVLSSEIGL
jgi:hypothetical protein